MRIHRFFMPCFIVAGFQTQSVRLVCVSPFAANQSRGTKIAMLESNRRTGALKTNKGHNHFI